MPAPEFEVKLRLPGGVGHSQVEAALLERGAKTKACGARCEQDAYFDTPHWDLYRHGYALRLRTGAQGSAAQLKELRPLQRGTAERMEFSAALEPGAGDWRALLPPEFAARLQGITGGQELRELFRVQQARELWRIAGPGFSAEVSLDEVCFFARGERCGDLRELEVELLEGVPMALREFCAILAQHTGWPYAEASKFEVGLQFAGLKPPAAS